jgi:hypothetical protein
MSTRIQYARRIALGAAFVVFSATTTLAQTANTDPRWQPWIGCWQATQDLQVSLVAAAPLVCVTPTAATSAVQIVTIDSGRVIARDTVNADNNDRQIARGGCTGRERAHFSPDASRVYLRSELTCGAGLKRTGTGLLSISPDGEWLDVQGMTAGGNSTVRATKFHEAKVVASDLPADIALASAGRELAIHAARTAAGAPLNSAAIIEAVDQLDTAVVQTWIVQRGRKFQLDGKGLMSLADAGVPGSVTDVIIGVSYPEHFALQEQPARLAGGGGLSPLDSARLASQYLTSRCYSGYDPLWSSSYFFDPCSSRYGFFGYAYSPYRYGGYGYNPYGYGYGYGSGYVSYAPIVVVKGADTPHGRVVNGHGYTRSSDDGASSGSRSRSSSSSSSGSHSSGGSASSSSSGSSSSGSSSGGRTAHGRP